MSIIAILLFLFAAGFTFGAKQGLQPDERIVFIGDSITGQGAGGGMIRGGGSRPFTRKGTSLSCHSEGTGRAFHERIATLAQSEGYLVFVANLCQRVFLR